MSTKRLEQLVVFRNKKRAAIILAALFVAVIIAALSYSLLLGTTRNDYSVATEKVNRTIATFNTAQRSLAAYRAGAVDATTSAANLEVLAKDFVSAQSEYGEAVTALAGMRALRNDDVRAAYDEFITKNTAFSKRETALASVLPGIHKKGTSCSESAIGRTDTADLAKVVAAYDAATAPCIAVMKGLAGSNNEQAVAVAKKALDYFADMRAHAVAMQAAYKANNRSKFESEYKAFFAKVDDFDADTDTSSITDLTALAPPTKELNDFMASIQAALK